VIMGRFDATALAAVSGLRCSARARPHLVEASAAANGRGGEPAKNAERLEKGV
jgi:hypothetical protein